MSHQETVAGGPVNYRTITVKTTDGSTLQGKINLTENKRVSDLFTQGDAPFIVLVDVAYMETTGKTFFINKNHIVWVEPEDN